MTLRNVRNCKTLCIVTMDTKQKSLHLFQCPIRILFFLFLHFHSKFAFSKQPFFDFFFFTLSLTALSLYSSWKKSRTFLGGEDGVPKWSCQKARSEWHNPFCICKWNESSLTTLFDFFAGLLFTFLLLFSPFFFSIFLTLPFFFTWLACRKGIF